MAGVPTYNKELRTVVQYAIGKFDLSTDATGKTAFTLPKGAIPLPFGTAEITTAFDGTTPTVKVGTSGDDDSLWASADIAPATAAVKQQVLATINAGHKVPLTADTDFVFTVGGGGSNTVGVVYIIQPFIVPYKFPDLL